MLRKSAVAALSGALLALVSQPAWAAGPWYSLSARAELGNRPEFAFGPGALLGGLGWLGLAQTQLSGRLPTVALTIGQTLAPNVDLTLSGSLKQDIDQPLANPELYEAYRSRIAWRQGGGQGLSPLYVPQIEDATVIVHDPDRNGQIQVGQFVVPFGFDDYASLFLPIAIAPQETPMTEYLSGLGPGVYQNSTLVRWRDIGAALSGRAGVFPYAFGVFNGSGPNRLDDNGAKDWFARLDWQSSATDLIGVSALWGQDQVFPLGFSDPGVAVGRRRYGMHWRFSMGEAQVKGEWASEQRLGLDPAPRDGYANEFSQTMGSGDRVYLTYSQFFDPNARPGVGYMIRETVLGDVRPLLPGLFLRFEASYRWETSGLNRDEYGRYLTSIEAALGGPPAAESENLPGALPTPATP